MGKIFRGRRTYIEIIKAEKEKAEKEKAEEDMKAAEKSSDRSKSVISYLNRLRKPLSWMGRFKPIRVSDKLQISDTFQQKEPKRQEAKPTMAADPGRKHQSHDEKTVQESYQPLRRTLYRLQPPEPELDFGTVDPNQQIGQKTFRLLRVPNGAGTLTAEEDWIDIYPTTFLAGDSSTNDLPITITVQPIAERLKRGQQHTGHIHITVEEETRSLAVNIRIRSQSGQDIDRNQILNAMLRREITMRLNRLPSDSQQERKTSVQRFVEIGTPAIPALVEALQNESMKTVSPIQDALAQIGRPALPWLGEALVDSNHRGHLQIVEILTAIGGEETIKPLHSALDDVEIEVRYASVVALGKIGSESVIPALVYALEDREQRIRLATLETLDRFREKIPLEPLIPHLNDVKPVKLKVIQIFENASGGQPYRVETIQKALLPLLGVEVIDVRRATASALKENATESLIEPFSRILTREDEDTVVCCVAAETLAKIKSEAVHRPLMQALLHLISEVRCAVIRALGQVGHSDTFKFLELALHYPNASDEERRLANEALQKAGGKRELEEVKDLDSTPSVQDLENETPQEELTPKAVPTPQKPHNRFTGYFNMKR